MKMLGAWCWLNVYIMLFIILLEKAVAKCGVVENLEDEVSWMELRGIRSQPELGEEWEGDVNARARV